MSERTEASAKRLVWYPQPKQHALISCPVEDVLFGGARGGGKTDGLAGDWLEHARRYGAGARGLFFRQTYPELEEVEQRMQEIFPAMGGTWRAAKHTWEFSNGARLRLRHLMNEQDAQQIQGQSNTWVGGDELGSYPTSRTIDLLRATLRSVSGVPCVFRGSANPGGTGHNWLKARYIDPAPPLTPFAATEVVAGETITVKRCFIPSTLEDNALLMRNDPQYWQRVMAAAGGNEALLKAWRYGLWDIVAGGMLDDVFDVRWHVVEPFPIPQGWAVRRAFDWGSSKPFAVGWFAHSDGESATPQGRVYPKGTRFLVAEYYGWNGKPNEGLRLTNTEIARHIRGIEDEGPYAGRVRPGPADTQIFDVVNGTSIADEMAREGIRWEAAQKGPGSRRQGAMLLRQRLKASRRWPLEEPGLFVFATCRQWLRTVPVVPRDPKNPDDVDCFVAGTLIDTPQGQVPIEDLVVHDYVHTPIGPRQILKAGVAGIVPTYTVICADGATLEGTFDHKIYVENRGLLPLCRVSLGDTLITRDELWTFEQSYMPMWSSGSIQDDDILSADQVPPSHWDQVSCSGWSGCESRGLSPTAMMSTTKIMTPPITTLRTWNSDLRVSMGDTISKSALRPVVISRQRLQHGVTQMLGRQPFATMLARCVQRLPSENLRALIVATLFERSILAKNTVPMPVKRPLLVKGASPSCALSVAPRRWSKAMAPGRRRPVVTSVVGSFASKPVYYLTIEQAHLFYANGILSANSDSEDHMYDCTRYELSMPPLQPARAMVLHL